MFFFTEVVASPSPQDSLLSPALWGVDVRDGLMPMMDWSSRDIIAAAWPPSSGAATGGGGGVGCVRLMAVGTEAGVVGRSCLPSVLTACQDHPIEALQWDERGDTLLTVDAVGGYVVPLDVSLGACCHVCWPRPHSRNVCFSKILAVLENLVSSLLDTRSLTRSLASACPSACTTTMIHTCYALTFVYDPVLQLLCMGSWWGRGRV